MEQERSVVEKAFQNIQYDYTKTVLDLIIKGFEEKQIKKDIDTPALAALHQMTGNSRQDILKEILTDLYEYRNDFDKLLVKQNQSTAMIVFGFNEKGLELQDVYLDMMGRTEYDEKNPAHKLCKSVIDQISDVL